jgi:hypothetical protein
MGQSIVPQDITDEIRRLRRDVDRLARLGGYGANQTAGLPDDVVLAETPQTLKNKSISGADNFLTSIPVSALPGSVVYSDLTPVAPPEDDPTHDADIAADILQFYPGMADASQQLVFGQSALGGHYRRQGNHVWFRIFFQAGVGFFGGSGGISFRVPWTCPSPYNQPLHLHFSQPGTQWGQLHWGGVAEFVQDTNKINLLLPFNNTTSNLGQLDEGVNAIPYPGPGGQGYTVIPPGAKVWVSGDVFVA